MTPKGPRVDLADVPWIDPPEGTADPENWSFSDAEDK
jgi:hypothetical protein